MFRSPALRLRVLAFSLVAAAACGGDPAQSPDAGPDARVPEASQALFVLPGTDDAQGFFALPYPNNLRIDSQGFINLDSLVRPNAFFADYFDTISERQTGFGITAATYMRFDGALDSAALPTEPIRTLIPDAPVYLVNVQQGSPNYGRKVALQVAFHAEGGDLIGDNWLSCLPYPGIVLEEASTYALVATNRLLAEDGSPVRSAAVFDKVMQRATSSDAAIANAQNFYEPLTTWLDEDGGDEREDVVSASVFTTQRPTELMGRFRRVIHESVPSPEARDITWRRDRQGYAIYTGRFDSPNFQAGEFPFKTLAQGGGFEFDEAGDPIVQDMFDLRFSMTIPTEIPMPEAGWPVALYAHGTTGDYLSYVNDGTAENMAERGIAVISIDQVMHGERLESGDVQTLFFNFQNPLSSRANMMQAALEDFQLMRLARNIDFVERHIGGRAVRFDASKVYFIGHSQGAGTGIPFAAHEPTIKGAMFSGASGLLYLTLITKTEPYDITELIRLVIRDPEITRFHPALALLQAFYEPADAIVYAKLLVQEPPQGSAPKNIFQPLGFEDTYTPQPTQEALATAFGLDLVAPSLQPIEGLELIEKRVLTAPVTNNAGEVTAVAAQYQPNSGDDGHFVIFDIPAARFRAGEFFRSQVETGKATIVAPQAQ